jgi:hypothetical protein
MVDANRAMPAVGEVWAYRARQADELVPVGVVRHGKKKPARVFVRFIGDEFEGQEDWVPPARLKVAWDQVAEYRARENQWRRLRQASLPRNDPRGFAVEDVVIALLEQYDASIDGRVHGAIRIGKPAELAAGLGLEPGLVSGHPLAFTEDGTLIVPWPVTELVVTTAAQQNPGPVLFRVENEERKARQEALHGYQSGRRTDSDGFIRPEICQNVDDEFSRPIREVLRSWCGAAAVGQADELTHLRGEVRRITGIAQQAIHVLKDAGQAKHAARLACELDVPDKALQLTDNHLSHSERRLS